MILLAHILSYVLFFLLLYAAFRWAFPAIDKFVDGPVTRWCHRLADRVERHTRA